MNHKNQEYVITAAKTHLAQTKVVSVASLQPLHCRKPVFQTPINMLPLWDFAIFILLLHGCLAKKMTFWGLISTHFISIHAEECKQSEVAMSSLQTVST